MVHLLVLAITLKSIVPLRATATYYAPKFENRLMANGQRYHANKDCLAFNRWPLGTKVKVTNPKTKRSIITRITDRKGGKGLDLSVKLFADLGLQGKGVGYVLVEKCK